MVVPTDPVEAYEAKGNAQGREAYYNPGGVFLRWAIASPWHRSDRTWRGHTLWGVAGYRLAARLRDERPDVVRAYGGHWPATLARAAAPPGTRVIASLHDTAPGLFGPGLAGCDQVWAVSDAAAERAQAVGVEPPRLRVIPNRVDTTHFCPDGSPSSAPVTRSLLFIGRLTVQKNLETLLAALAELPADVTLTVVGQGNPVPYQRLAHAMGVADRVRWVPRVAQADLPVLYRAHGVFATPSRWEGFGLVFLEAAACGCAIVAPSVPPVRGLLEDGVQARLVDPEDAPAWAEAIRRVWAEPEETQRLRRSARERALDFDHAIIDARAAEAYRALLADPARETVPAERRRLRMVALRQETLLLAKAVVKQQLRR